MTRPLRVLFEGAWYHVMNRGGSKRTVFPTDEDRADFLRLLGEMEERFRVELHAYCLMGNHYHLLIRTPLPNLPEAMRHLDGVFTQRFNRRHGTDGAILRGRYRAILVQADRYLLHVSRYIHLNPVEAGLVRRPEHWPHSSFRAYLDPLEAPRWLETSAVLGCFGMAGARGSYRRFVEIGVDPKTRAFYSRPRLRPVLGEEGFCGEILRRLGYIPDEVSREVPDLRRLIEPVPLDTIAREIAEAFASSLERGRSRVTKARKDASIARGAFVHAARRLGGWRLREIGAFLGYTSYDAASRAAVRFQAAATADVSLAARLASVLDRLEGRVGPCEHPAPDVPRDPETAEFDLEANVET